MRRVTFTSFTRIMISVAVPGKEESFSWSDSVRDANSDFNSPFLSGTERGFKPSLINNYSALFSGRQSAMPS